MAGFLAYDTPNTLDVPHPPYNMAGSVRRLDTVLALLFRLLVEGFAGRQGRACIP